jgi:multicomponent Na+:H+ antiporter subunit A
VGFADETWWTTALVAVGALTMFTGGIRALRAYDLKQILAFGTISQLGLLVVLFGIGRPETTTAGIVLLVAHALFKATLFMTVGVIDHAAHTRDIRKLSGVGRSMPAVAFAGLVAALSMAGVPPLVGFVAKEKVLDVLLDHRLALVAVAFGSVLTVAYSCRYAWGAFATKRHVESAHDLHRTAVTALVPMLALAVATVVAGVAPAVLQSRLDVATTSIGGKVAELKLWHGLNVPLLLSVIVITAGVLVHSQRRRIEAVPTMPVSAQGGYDLLLRATPVVGKRTSGVVQSGSLRIYLSVIIGTVVLLPGVVLARNWVWPSEAFVAADGAMQWALLVVISAAAIATAAVRRRFAAVICVGAVGYGVAALFVIQGAPDLALTQVLVETLSVVIFVLVLRHLPDRFSRRRQPAHVRAGRIFMASVVGIATTLMLLVAGGVRTADRPAAEYLAQAKPIGGGSNVVNVILVDFRGLDTAGEITVLVVTALGVVGLISAAKRDREREGAQS